MCILRGLRGMISDEFKGKMRFINIDDETQYVDVPLEKGIDSKWGDLLIEKLTGRKEKLPVELFEESLPITNEQRIALYEDWGNTKAIMIKDVARNLGISRNDAIEIVGLASKYRLLTRGHNNTWKVINNTIQDRWKLAAIEIAKENKPLNYNMPQTPQESLDKLAKMSTSEQKRIARGETMETYYQEEGMIVQQEVQHDKKTEIKTVEVISDSVDDSRIYSPAAKAKEAERKQWEHDVKEGGKKALQEMNEASTKPKNLPKCVTILPSREEQFLSKKKPLSKKPPAR